MAQIIFQILLIEQWVAVLTNLKCEILIHNPIEWHFCKKCEDNRKTPFSS